MTDIASTPELTAEVEDIYPLTPVQRGLLPHVVDGGTCAYLEQVVATLEGPVDIERLHRCWEYVVARHPALRTSLTWQNRPDPLQVVWSRVDLPFTVHDWTSWEPDRQRTAEQELVVAERSRGFDPSIPPLMRFHLIVLAPNRLRVIWTYHHIVIDGTSFAVLLLETAAAYERLGRGEELDRVPAAGFRNYVAWQRNRDCAGDRAYWTSALADMVPTSLPVMDTPGSENPADDGKREVLLDETDSGAIRESLRGRRFTFATVAQAAWLLVLSRVGREHRVVTGLGSAGRPAELPESSSMIGMFVNTVPLCMSVPPDARVDDWLRQVQLTAAGAREHEHTSIGDIAEWVGLDPGTPLFESAIAVQTYTPDIPESRARYADARIGEVRDFVRVDIPLLAMAVPGQRISLRLVYNPARVAGAAATALLEAFEAAFRALVANPAARLGSIALLSEPRLREVLVAGTGPACPAVASVPAMVRATGLRYPNLIAIDSGAATLTYRQMQNLSDRLSHRLIDRGIGMESIVALYLGRSVELVVAVMGVLGSGAAFVVMDPSAPDAYTQAVLDRARPALVITTEGRIGDLPDGLPALDIGDCTPADEDGSDPTPRLPASAFHRHSLACVVFTSGSTGVPKGIQNEHGALAEVIDHVVHRLGLEPGQSLLQFCSITFDAFLLEVFATLAGGARLCVGSDSDVAPGPELARTIGRFAVTTLVITPSSLELLPPDRVPSLQTIWAVGEAARAESVDRCAPGRVYLNGYGPAEVTILTTMHTCLPGAGEDPPVGRAIPGVTARVLDPDGRPLPFGVRGELFHGGLHASRGYLGDPARTAACYVADPYAAVPGSRMYATGDRAELDADGVVRVLGRLDWRQKIRGQQVDPSTVEAVILEHPTVAAVAVTPRGDGTERRLVAHLTLVEAAGGADAVDEYRRHWNRLWDSTYTTGLDPSGPDADATLDIPENRDTVGWVNSATRELYSAELMQEWATDTLDRIRRLPHRDILEIGSGTGMLALPLVRSGARVIATDISGRALRYIDEQSAAGDFHEGHLETRVCRAEDLSEFGDNIVDLVVMNSVAQYLVGADLLDAVLTSATRLVRPGGALFVGDVRSLPHAVDFHLWTHLERIEPDVRAGDALEAARLRAASDAELLVHPLFFLDLAERLSARAVIMPKRSSGDTEMNRFRYDVVIHVPAEDEPEAADRPVRVARWSSIVDANAGSDAPADIHLSAEVLDEVIADRPDEALVVGIPDPRLRDVRMVTALAPTDPLRSAADDTPGGAGLSVETVDRWARSRGYAMLPLVDPDRYRYAVALVQSAKEPNPAGEEWTATLAAWVRTWRNSAVGLSRANDPTGPGTRRRMIREIREHTAARLPRYAVPTSWTVVDELPSSRTGKLDRRAVAALPEYSWSAGVCVRPRDSYETRVAAVWERLLNVTPIGITDNFYDLGGHSMIAVRIIAELEQEFGVRIALTGALLERHTVENMAALLREQVDSGARSTLVPLRSGGTAIPFVCVHPAGGSVLPYAQLAHHLGADQPFYGLEAVDPEIIAGGIGAVADHYLQEVLRFAPDGRIRLGGWSFGGYVAYEIATGLARVGIPVEPLILFDTPVDTRPTVVDDAYQVRLVLKCALYVESVAAVSLGITEDQLIDKDYDGRVAVLIDACRECGLVTATAGEQFIRNTLASYRNSVAAVDGHVPSTYDGDLVLLRATEPLPDAMTDPDDTGTDRTLGWGAHCTGRIEVIDVPGNHLTMMAPPHIDRLSEIVSTLLAAPTADGGPHIGPRHE